MKAKEIKELISFLADSGMAEINLETAEIKLHIKRNADSQVQLLEAAPQPQALPAHPQPAALPAVPAPEPAAAPSDPAAAPSNVLEIKSPMIGTFYRSSSPESPPFVNVGDKITKGQTVCIVEAMKLFNEIESEVSGTVVKVIADNASPVEYDQVLFQVQPD